MAKSVLLLPLLLIVSVFGRPKYHRDERQDVESDDTFLAFKQSLQNAVEANSSAIVRALRSCQQLRDMVCTSQNTAGNQGNQNEGVAWLFTLAHNALNKTTKEDMDAVFMAESRLPTVMCDQPATTAAPANSEVYRDLSFDEYLSILSQRKKRSLARVNKREKPLQKTPVEPEEDVNDGTFSATTTVVPAPQGPTVAKRRRVFDEGQFDEAIVIDPDHHNIDPVEDLSPLEDQDIDPASQVDDDLPHEKVDEPIRDAEEPNKLALQAQLIKKESLDDELEPVEVQKENLDEVIDRKLKNFLKAEEEPIEKKTIPNDEKQLSNDETLERSKEVLKELLLDKLADDLPKPKPHIGSETKYEEDDQPEIVKKQ